MYYYVHADACGNKNGCIIRCSLTVALAMRLTLLFTIVLSIHATANVLAQRISLKAENEKLENVLKEMRRQSGYAFIYSSDYLANAKPVTLHVTGKDIHETLTLLFADQPFTFTIKDKVITIVPKAILETGGKQPASISGTVTDSLNNPLQHVNVQVVGTALQTVTDRNGRFEVKGVAERAALRFSLLSYEAVILEADRPILNVVLRLVQSNLEEVVVERGYYSTSKRLNTGSASTITSEDISTQPVGNALLSLQGRVPGLYVNQTTGVPGRGITVELRGRNSIANGNDPLYVIDGVPFPSNSLQGTIFGAPYGSINPLNSINIDDIESITVLKDADATSIYGSLGANGVILITTKKGKAGQTEVQANIYSGFGKTTRMIDLLNTEQYLEMRREAFANDGLNPRPADYDVNGTWDETRYTDWQEVFMGGTSRSTSSQIRLSGGTNNTQFTLNGGYRKETTILPGDYSDRIISIQSNVNHVSSDQKLKISFSSSLSNNINQIPRISFSNYITLAPNAPKLHNEDGTLNWENGTWTNPFAQLNARERINTYNFLGNGSIGYQLPKGFALNASFGYNKIDLERNILMPITMLSPAQQNRADLRRNQMVNSKLRSWIIEPQISYQKTFLSSQLDVLLGTTFRESIQDQLAQTASGFSDDALMENINAASNVVVNSFGNSKYRYNAIYGRIGYTLKDKYILNLTGRRDGSSRFGPGKRFGNFAAVGGAWIFMDEAFAQPITKILNFGKIRASYGVTGNDQLGDYQYLSTYQVLNFVYVSNSGLSPTRHTNPDYSWEAVRKLETAVDLGFFNNKLQLTAGWYLNRTNNQLVGFQLPEMTGFNTVQANLPAVIQNKGIELEASLTVGQKDRFNWQASGNISFPRNKLVAYPDLSNSSYRTFYAIGKSMTGGYRYKYIGVDPASGVYQVVDINADNSFTIPDDTEFIDLERDFYGGFQNTFSLKQWSLSFLFHFAKQQGPGYYSNGYPGSFNMNQPVTVLDRWQEPGDEGKLMQRFTTGANYWLFQDRFSNSDGVIEDASFLSLKNLSLSWTAPKHIVSKAMFQDVRLYIQAQNLFVLSKYKGLNVEAMSTLSVPPIRMVTAGVQLTF